MRKPKTVSDVAFVGLMMGAGMVANHLLGKAWEKSTSRPPPMNPAAPEVKWGEALLWGAVAGVVVGLTRTVAQRVLSEVMEDHATPTGLQDD